MPVFRTKGKGKNRKVYPIHKKKIKEYPSYQPEFTTPNFIDEDNKRKLMAHALIKGAIIIAPMSQEIYLGYTSARLIYSSWNMIYNAYKNQDALKHQAYDFARNEVKTGLTNYQTGLIWDNIKDNNPKPVRNETCNQLTNFMSNITEEEISFVEQTLSAF